MPLITDLLSRASNGTPPQATTLASQKALGASSLSLNLATGWDTSTPVHFLLYEVDANSNITPSTTTLWKGTLSGTTVSNLTLRGGSDATYPANSPVELVFTSAQLDDLVTALQVSHNPDGTMVNNLPLTAPVLTSPTTQGLVSGWVGANESWTYASATTITVPSDATTKYYAGDYIQVTQSATVKFFVITGVASTLLTIDGSGIYTLANSTISSPAYSKTANPQGLAPGFGNNQLSFSNAGTAGGTFWYLNKNGQKELWGETSNIAVSGAGKTITLPVGFFTTVQSAIATVTPISNFAQYANVVNVSSTTCTVSTQGAAGSPAVYVHLKGI